MKKVYILAILTLLGQSSLSFAQIRDFQTTRLNSSAGAGVASLLSTEAAILNPASATYFQDGDFSYHYTKSSLYHKNSLQRSANNDPYPSQSWSQGLFMSDYSGTLKGGASYITQKENNFERQRFGLHAAAPTGNSSSVGISYRYTMDTLPKNKFSKGHNIFHQVSVGMMTILDEDTSLGLVLVDPTRSNNGDERVLGGFQYRVADKLTLIADAGYKYTGAVSKDYLWRGSVQFSLFSDFFLRVGQFYDNITYFKGYGWGFSWVGPRLGVEFGQKFSEQFGQGTYLYNDETIVDTTLSAIIKF